MKRRSFGVAVLGILALVIVVGSIATIHAREVESSEKKILGKLLIAIEDGDYNSFVEDVNADFKASITKKMFEGVSGQLSPRMKNGYESTYLGNLRQQGSQVYLWKLVFKDGGDDILARLALKDGAIAGFWLQ